MNIIILTIILTIIIAALTIMGLYFIWRTTPNIKNKEQQWHLNIEKVEDGYILKHNEQIKEGIYRETRRPIEDRGDSDEALSRLLHSVADHFGYQYSKFSEENLRISFDGKGHKVD